MKMIARLQWAIHAMNLQIKKVMRLKLRSCEPGDPANKGFNRTPVSYGPAKPGSLSGGAG